MPQAKRTIRNRQSSHRGQPPHGLRMLIVGMIIGSLATLLWQGMRSSGGGVGTGIREVIEQSRQKDQQETSDQQGIDKVDKPIQQPIDFDFFTVLPEIETVVPDNQPLPSPSSLSPSSPTSSAPSPDVQNVEVDSSRETQAVSNDSIYMLQAGSYQNKTEADRLKAELALQGYLSQIQKVTIQGRGDFFRVRLGPYPAHSEMVEADNGLASIGIKALRLKISRGG